MMDYKRLVSRILMLAIAFAAGWLLVFIVACYIGSTAPTAPTVIVAPGWLPEERMDGSIAYYDGSSDGSVINDDGKLRVGPKPAHDFSKQTNQ